MVTDEQQSQMERVVAGALVGVVRALVMAGETPSNAFRLAAFVVIEGTFGREVVAELGVPYSTAARWRATLRDLDVSRLPEDVPVEVINDMLPLFGIDGVELRRKD